MTPIGYVVLEPLAVLQEGGRQLVFNTCNKFHFESLSTHNIKIHHYQTFSAHMRNIMIYCGNREREKTTKDVFIIYSLQYQALI